MENLLCMEIQYMLKDAIYASFVANDPFLSIEATHAMPHKYLPREIG